MYELLALGVVPLTHFRVITASGSGVFIMFQLMYIIVKNIYAVDNENVWSYEHEGNTSQLEVDDCDIFKVMKGRKFLNK